MGPQGSSFPMQEAATTPPPDCSLMGDKEPGALFCPTMLVSPPYSQALATKLPTRNTTVPRLGCCPAGTFLPPTPANAVGFPLPLPNPS